MEDILVDGGKIETNVGSMEPVITPKDMENKDGMFAKMSKVLPSGAALGGSFVDGNIYGMEGAESATNPGSFRDNNFGK